MSKNCYLICGDDDFQVAMEARNLIDKLVPEETRMFGLEVVDGRVEPLDESLAVIRKCLESMMMDGLFGSEKLIWLRDPSFLSIDRIARSAVIKDGLAELTALIRTGLPEGQRLVVTTGRINRSSAFYKAFHTAGEVHDLGNNLKAWECEKRARQFLDRWLPVVGLNMDETLKAPFLARVGTDSRQIANELEKLCCYVGVGKQVIAADVEAIVSGGSVTEIWAFIDAFGKRNMAELLRQLHRLLTQSEHPIRLANSLESRVNDLLLIREAMDRQWALPDGYAGLRWNALPPEAEGWFSAQENNIRKWPPFRVKKLVIQANAWTLRDLRVARHRLVQMREKLVSSSLPQEWLLEVTLIQALGQITKAHQTAK
jgi:DNA polymerase III subunit delta